MTTLAAPALTLLLMTFACAGTTQTPPRTETTGPHRMACQGPVILCTQADVRSVTAMCSSIDGDLVVAGTSLSNVHALERIRSTHAQTDRVASALPER